MPVKTPPPHIRREISVRRMMWTVVLALGPAVAASLILSGFQAFRVLVVATAASLLTEIGARKVFGKQPAVGDGSAVISALLFALLLPPALPSWMVALGSAFGILFGKEIFGGLGQNPFNPALVGCVFLWLAFPFKADLFMNDLAVLNSFLGVGALVIGGAMLLGARLIHWEIPFLYLGSVVGFSAALGHPVESSLLSGVFLFAALFLVTDPVTSPITRAGERWFALGSGLLAALTRPLVPSQASMAYAILTMNAMNPWLDRYLRPSRSLRLQKRPEALERIKILRLEPKSRERGGPRSFQAFALEFLRWLAFISLLALLLYGLNHFYGARGE